MGISPNFPPLSKSGNIFVFHRCSSYDTMRTDQNTIFTYIVVHARRFSLV